MIPFEVFSALQVDQWPGDDLDRIDSSYSAIHSFQNPSVWQQHAPVPYNNLTIIKKKKQWGWQSGPCAPCFAQIHSAVLWLTRRKVWEEFPGVCTTVVLVKPPVVPFDLVCGNWGLSSETLLFFTYWLYWKSCDGPDISGIASCRRLCHRD